MASSPLSSISDPVVDHTLSTPLRFFPIHKTELNLEAVLKCGQTFRWKRTQLQKPDNDSKIIRKLPLSQNGDIDDGRVLVEWSMASNDRTIVLRQDDEGIHYVSIYRPEEIQEYEEDCINNTTYKLLKKYFVLDISLVDLYKEWSKRDRIFSEKVGSGLGKWDGLRVVRQDSWETLISFICSANNNIPRITLMINRLCAEFGTLMAEARRGITVPKYNIKDDDPGCSSIDSYNYSFPTPNRLSQSDVLQKLKALGFGYRAGYVHKTSIKICEISSIGFTQHSWPDRFKNAIKEEDHKPINSNHQFKPLDFLTYLSEQEYEFTHKILTNEFPGVGPKVGDCICLFGLGFVKIVPIDIHIYKIALRDYHFDILSNTSPLKNRQLIKKENEKNQNTSKSRKSSLTPSPNKKKKKLTNNLSPTTKPPPLSRLNYLKIQNFFIQLWGPWAGWTQQILFLADLNKTPT
ncbi:hypothetical protein MJO29_012744 [Puccinia striiformis f. sp. tritici]|uniref:hypothetical protein n=1 Tax=Puccinia striiformis f. sp. tritici TaxID=168172 RepID=UPI00200746AA|nr:hypothetical protein Pst134EA_024197 [Puccinia striiformis f. sp. tritici]KAH9453317.1 hypothetical protein Pst134EA_024197 [Puccinia striiformis f. sp. tritici]KAI7942900.1 hypothetical protein MJO29_012744 [Puccinia striiformis f. sp. tritici]KAI9606652.1 hypothetical protein H4Q26_006188 [Puccinia striiformis f. sp. tritici PST-130]